jgi:hypothetical protein
MLYIHICAVLCCALSISSKAHFASTVSASTVEILRVKSYCEDTILPKQTQNPESIVSEIYVHQLIGDQLGGTRVEGFGSGTLQSRSVLYLTYLLHICCFTMDIQRKQDGSSNTDVLVSSGMHEGDTFSSDRSQEGEESIDQDKRLWYKRKRLASRTVRQMNVAGSTARNMQNVLADQTRASQIRHTRSKTTAAQMSFGIGIAEGGARTHDLEVDLFAVIRATRSTN